MKNYWTGIVLILIGLLFLFDTMGIVEFNYIVRKFWPVALILIGVNILLKRQKKKS